MRLWHWRLLPYLPKGQLLSQKRECDLIWKDLANGKKTNHILINYIWEYNDYEYELLKYYELLEEEFDNRNYKFKRSKYSYDLAFGFEDTIPFKNHHNERYLMQCYYNLEEKYDRGQKDFDCDIFNKLKTSVILEILERR